MIEYTVSPLLGIPLTWLTEIVQVDAPHRFVDETTGRSLSNLAS